MSRVAHALLRAASALMPTLVLIAQPSQNLTLADAERIALHNHPSIRASQLTAQAANQVIIETGSANQPAFFGSITGAGASDGSRIAAGALNNPIIYDRFASGISGSQLITDFGRTRNLVESSKLHEAAQN